MKRVLRFLTSRIFLTGLVLVLQLGWIIFFLVELTSYSVYLNAIFTVLSVLIVLSLIKSYDNPSYRIAWMLVIMLQPILGGLLYLLLGNKRPARRLLMRISAAQKAFAPAFTGDPAAMEALAAEHPRLYGRSHYLHETGGCPVYRSTATKYYALGEDMYRDMLEAVESAKHFVFLEFFIIRAGVMWDGLLEILTRKAAEGVDVRLMYDDLNSFIYLPDDFLARMAAVGIKCQRFNPVSPLFSFVMNNRDHRKILVVDGHTAFNGGINLSDEYINHTHPYGHWKDSGIRLIGDAVWGFTAMFLVMWNAFEKTDTHLDSFRPRAHHPKPFEGTGFVQPFGDSPLDHEPLSENLYLDIIATACRYVYIATPYLIIDDALHLALTSAAKRGVDVRIVTPGIPDKRIVFRLTRSHYASLMKNGVRIYEYTPGFLHAKSIVSDDIAGVVGTINLDYRSLYLHFECGTCLYGADSIEAIKRDALETFAVSREITPDSIKDSFWASLVDAILRLFAPLC